MEEMKAIGQEGNDCDGPKKYDVPQGGRDERHLLILKPFYDKY